MPLAAKLVRFGAFELDLRAGELRKSGAKIKLQEQPFQLLTTLLEHPGGIVTREELQRTLWSNDTFVDFDHSLNAAVKRLREALGDSAENPQFIETLPRHGYRFICPVDGSTRTEEEIPVTAARVPRWPLLAAAVLVLLLLVGTVYFLRRATHSAHFSGKRVMLAVLPFENLSKDPEQEYFSDGMTEEIINQLARLAGPHLGVIAATSSMQYKGAGKKISQIGHELNVDYIVEGSVRQEDDRVRITAQLIAVEDEAHVWADSYERNSSDILTLQREVAQAVTRGVKLSVAPPANAVVPRTAAVNPEAYDAYLRGRYFGNKWTAEGFSKAIVYFQRSIDIDPSFAIAYAGLASAYSDMVAFDCQSANEGFPKAQAAARKALELDQALAEAHAALAEVMFMFDWN